MLIVGLTGNIASGKTTIARFFRQLGAAIIDVDRLGHKLLSPGELVWKRIGKSFGNGILNDNQAINRKRLGKIVFADFKKLEQLNAIIHPFLIQKVKEESRRLKRKLKEGVVIIDGALLIEMKPLERILDYLILVKIDRRSQIKRLAKSQSGLRQGEILKRIKAQLPQREKIKWADFIIDNSGSLLETKKQVKKIWKKLNAEEPVIS